MPSVGMPVTPVGENALAVRENAPAPRLRENIPAPRLRENDLAPRLVKDFATTNLNSPLQLVFVGITIGRGTLVDPCYTTLLSAVTVVIFYSSASTIAWILSGSSTWIF